MRNKIENKMRKVFNQLNKENHFSTDDFESAVDYIYAVPAFILPLIYLYFIIQERTINKQQLTF